MVFGDERDWKELLAPENQRTLAEMFETAKRHKSAYMQAEDVKVAQLWCALVEMQKTLDEIKQTVEKVTGPFKAIVAVGEAEKRRAIERVVREIVKPTEEATEEATKKLVESLMKF